MAERLVLAADHGGFDLKQELAEGLREAGYVVSDLGTAKNTACDYPDYAHAAAQGILSGRYDRGILICGTGVGMAITKKIVEYHNGTISIDSEPGRGSEFTITFPVNNQRKQNDQLQS